MEERKYTPTYVVPSQMSLNQHKMINRLESLRPYFLHPQLRWLRGYKPMPDWYHRLSLTWKEANDLAIIGYNTVKEETGAELYFTQAVLAGLMLESDYRVISCILGTGFGKSFVSSQCNLVRANRGELITAFAPNRELNSVIFKEMVSAVNHSPKLKKVLFEAESKEEALQRGVSQKRFAFPSGGFVDLTIAKNATGVHSSSYMDEYALLTKEEYNLAEGRAYAYVDKDGKPGKIFKTSNPHIMNFSYDDMIRTPLPPHEAVLWGDWRLNIGEGKFMELVYSQLDDKHEYLKDKFPLNREERDYLLDQAIQQVIWSPFFNDEDNLRILYLSEFGVNTESAFFTTTPKIDDSPIDWDNSTFYAGNDVAIRGTDACIYALLEHNPNKSYSRIVAFNNVKPQLWIDHETPKEMAQNVIRQLKHDNARLLAIDASGVGEGQFNLLTTDDAETSCPVVPVRFGDGASKWRKDKNAVRSLNKRSELFLDFKEFIDTDTLRVTSEVWEFLQAEMQAVTKMSNDENKKIKIEPKDAIKKRLGGKSTDYLDSSMLALHALILDKLGAVTAYNKQDDSSFLEFQKELHK